MSFTIGDYKYSISDIRSNAVSVEVADRTKTHYEDIPDTVTYNGRIYDVIDGRYCFSSCKNMVEAPAIPDSIEYMRVMFASCESMVNPPVLPGYVADGDLFNCFAWCYSLKSPPVIPSSAKDISGFLGNCTSLTTAPVIPRGVTKMDETFWGCTSLVAAPEIPDTVDNMFECFENCTSLTSAPVLPSSLKTVSACFRGCTSLESLPELPEGVESINAYYQDRTELVDPPHIPSSVTSMVNTFNGCTSLVSPPVIPYGVKNLYWCFSNCSSMTRAPELPDGIENMFFAFAGCTSMVNVPVIPSTVTDLIACFQGCKSLKGNAVVKCTPGTYVDYRGEEHSYAMSMFSRTEHPIYIINEDGADYDTWKAIADEYDNVYMLTEGNSRPVLEFAAKRVASDGDEEEDPEGDCVYIVANATAYADRLPEGFVNDVYRLDLSDNGDAVEAEWEVVSKDYMEYKTTVVMRTWVDLSTARHLLAMVAVDKYGAKSASITQIVAKTSMLLDFLAGNVGTGLAIGKKATREGLDVAIPSNFDTRVNVAGKLSLPVYMYSVPPEISVLPFLPAVVVCLNGTGWIYTSKKRMQINHYTPESQYAPGTWGYLKDTTTWGDLIGGK